MTAVAVLADWATGVPAGHGAIAASRAKSAFLDTIGYCLLGAGNAAEVAARQVAAAWGSRGGAGAALGMIRHTEDLGGLAPLTALLRPGDCRPALAGE